MALIRGVGSLHPCPRCLIHIDSLGYIKKTAPHRTTKDMMATVEQARNVRLASEREEILKEVGLRCSSDFYLVVPECG